MDMDIERPTPDYFYSNTKGHLMEKHIKRVFPDFYQELLNYPDGLKFSERIYWYVNGIESKPTCPICGKPTNFKNFTQGYHKFCSYGCSIKSGERIAKMKSTTLERYGVENASQSPAVKDKKKRTLQEHYGVDIPLQSYKIQEKMKSTTLERYGVENASQSPVVKDKKKRASQKRYGVDHPFQSDEIRDKYKQTCLRRYGVENTFQIPGVKDKQIKSFYEKFMADHKNILSIEQNDGIWIYTCKCPHPECGKCPGIFEIPAKVFNNRFYSSSELCTRLLPVDNSHNSGGTLELFIQSMLDEYDIEYKTNNRTILGGKELDIYIPAHKLAIECNGIYWHSLKEPKYHHEKWKICMESGIRLLTLWEDQIKNKPEIVRNLILSKLGIYGYRVGARECELKDVPASESRSFLDRYHLQGSVNGSVRLGLYYKNELVGLMAFGRKRAALGNQDHDTWELYRYCCKQGWQIIGGASRLFNHFISEHPGSAVVSFSSNDISSGELYRQLGFNNIGMQAYSYWYINKHMVRYHRYTFRKDVLVRNGADPALTEFQITDRMGLFRIYDSGQQKWRYDS